MGVEYIEGSFFRGEFLWGEDGESYQGSGKVLSADMGLGVGIWLRYRVEVSGWGVVFGDVEERERVCGEAVREGLLMRKRRRKRRCEREEARSLRAGGRRGEAGTSSVGRGGGIAALSLRAGGGFVK